MAGKQQYDRERIVQLWRSGVPSSHIARRMGCSRRTVNRAIREHVKKAGDESSST